MWDDMIIEKAMDKKVADRNAETTIEQFGASLADETLM